MAEPHRHGRWMREYRWTILRAIPLGFFLPMSFFLGSVGPDDVARNYASWARKLGLTDWADWFAQFATGSRVFWSVLLISLVYLAIAFGLPFLIKHTKRDTAAVAVPVSVALILIVTLYGWHSIGAVSQWYISPKQENNLKAALAASSVRFVVPITVVPAAPSDAMDVAYKIKDIIGGSNGWGAVVSVIGDAQYSPHNIGLLIAVARGTNADQNQSAHALKDIFDAADLHPTYVYDPFVSDGEVKIVIGRNP
jgi:hypothetical protein